MYVPMYALNESPEDHFSLDEFLANNECLDPEEIETIRTLQPGQSYTGGGGAEAEWTITHVKKFNPRFERFCEAIGRDPEELSTREPDGDIKRVPYTDDPQGRSGPWTSVFMLWVQARWTEWGKVHGHPRGKRVDAITTEDDHIGFDAWLRERTLQGNVD